MLAGCVSKSVKVSEDSEETSSDVTGASSFLIRRSLSKAVEAQKARQRRRRPTNLRPKKNLAAIWSKLLAIDRVGSHDNFFALGGHSLMAVQVIARVRQSLGNRDAAAGHVRCSNTRRIRRAH